ncbi:MAG: hypothetical protein AAFQ41_03160 [Cyanobacteria bacterium J06623_7]
MNDLDVHPKAQATQNMIDALGHAAEQTDSYENSMAWLEAFEAAIICHCPELQIDVMQVIGYCSEFLHGYHGIECEDKSNNSDDETGDRLDDDDNLCPDCHQEYMVELVDDVDGHHYLLCPDTDCRAKIWVSNIDDDDD